MYVFDPRLVESTDAEGRLYPLPTHPPRALPEPIQLPLPAQAAAVTSFVICHPVLFHLVRPHVYSPEQPIA